MQKKLMSKPLHVMSSLMVNMYIKISNSSKMQEFCFTVLAKNSSLWWATSNKQRRDCHCQVEQLPVFWRETTAPPPIDWAPIAFWRASHVKGQVFARLGQRCFRGKEGFCLLCSDSKITPSRVITSLAESQTDRCRSWQELDKWRASSTQIVALVGWFWWQQDIPHPKGSMTKWEKCWTGM